MVFLSVMSVGIYVVFLFIQNHRHRGFFTVPEAPAAPAAPGLEPHSAHSTLYHAAMLGAYGLPLVLLAKQMAAPLDALVFKLGAPPALGGFIMALLVLTPESIAAIRAALANQMQRSVNILLGSVLASIGLTIPLVIAVSLVTGRTLVLGIDAVGTVMLLLTLLTSILEAIKRFLPWLVAVAFFMQSLDTTILNTAVPAIAKALGIAPLSMKAVLSSYTLSLAVFIPISGWMADRFGTRRVFAWAIGTVHAGLVALRHFEQHPSAGRLPRPARLRRGDDGAGGAAHAGADVSQSPNSSAR
jgi:hypothetical protein